MDFMKLCMLCCAFLATYAVADLSPNEKPSSKQSILDQLSPSTLKQLLKEIGSLENDDSQSECSNQFDVLESQIIRTKDSLRNGATFLHALSDVDTALECKNKCCSYSDDSTGTLVQCNLAVYQLQKIDDKPRCFFFDCYSKDTGNFSCLFSPNRGFTSFKGPAPKTTNAQLQELENIAKSESQTTTGTTVIGTTTTMTTITSTPVQTSTTTATTTTTAPKTTTTSTTLQTTSSEQTTTFQDKNACSTQKCQRFEWQCDNKCCIPFQNICDGTPHCSDESDEFACPTAAKPAEKSSSDGKPKDEMVIPTSTSMRLIPSSSSLKKAPITSTLSVPPSTSVMKADEAQGGDASKTTGEEPELVEPEAGAVLPLAIGLAVTVCVLLMVACRVRIMKRKLRRRGKPLLMDESDYLINGMYL